MKKMIALLLLLFIATGCTKVNIVEEKVQKALTNETGIMEKSKEVLNKTQEVIADISYETPASITKKVVQETEVEDFGDII